MQNLILFWTFKLKHLGLLVWSPYNLLVILILDMWFCNLFNVSVRQSVGYVWKNSYAHSWLTYHRIQTQVALFAHGFCVIGGYCQHSFSCSLQATYDVLLELMQYQNKEVFVSHRLCLT